MSAWLLLGVLAGIAWLRIGWGYPRPAREWLVLAPREIAFIQAAASATFPPGGAIPPSGADADVPAYTDRWLRRLPTRTRRLIRLLFFLVEHATLVIPAPGWRGFRRFSSLLPGQQAAVLEGWRTSRFRARRLVFASLRAIVTMGYFAHPPVLRRLGLAPRAIRTPVCEADLLFPPIGRGREAITHTRADLARPRETTPLDATTPIDPRYAEPAP